MEVRESPKKSREVQRANRHKEEGSSRVESSSLERDEVEKVGTESRGLWSRSKLRQTIACSL